MLFRRLLWGYVEKQVYKNNPQAIHELKDEIISVIRKMEPQLCQDLIENLNKSPVVCRATRGGFFINIIFRTKCHN